MAVIRTKMDYFSAALFVLFAALSYFGEVETQGMNTTTPDNMTAVENNMTTTDYNMTTTVVDTSNMEFMNGTEFNTTTADFNSTTTDINMNITITTDGDFAVKGDNMFQDGEKNLMVALAIVIAVNCMGVVVFVVWIIRKCLRDNARKTAARFYQYDNKAPKMADDISVDTSTKRKLSTIAESDLDSMTMKSTSKAASEVQTESDDHGPMMELSRLSSASGRIYGSESENV